MPTWNVEHIAWNVADPAAVADWYVSHLGMRVVRSGPAPTHVRFLADASGRVVVEIYNNTADPVPDYAAQHPARLHFAFHTDDPDGSRNELIAAGATLVDELTAPDGSRLVMLRDPWGLALQLCQRTTPLLPAS